MVRVAEGVYRRGDTYQVPIWNAEKKGRDWHGPRCGPECGHDRIVDFDSAKAAKRQLEARKHRLAGRSDETVGEWADRWLTVFPRKKESTNLHNTERIRSFVAEFKGRSLRALGTPKGEKDVWAWATGHPSSVTEVRAMLNDAIKLRLLEENPLRHFTLPESRGRGDIQTLTLDELDLLLEAAHEEWKDFGGHMAAMIEAAAWTGARPGELFMFSLHRPTAEHPRVNFVDVDGSYVDLKWQWNVKVREVTTPKWDSDREVVLLPRARDALRSIPDPGPGPLFRTQRGAPYTGRTHHYYWDPIRRAFARKLPPDHWLRIRMAENPKNGDLDFYELRHFFGTALAHPPAGIRPASPYEIAQQMGHKDGGQLAMKIYIHTEGQRVVRSLTEAWAGQAPRKRRAG